MEVRQKFGEFRGEIFYRSSFAEENDKVFASVFVVEQLFKELKEEASIWLSGDGTFSIVPLGFTQLYCILGVIKGKILPILTLPMPHNYLITIKYLPIPTLGRPRLVALVLMTGRRQYMYHAIFEFMRDELNLDVAVFMTDFEKPARNAIKAVWHQAQLKGCYVHFCRALTRKSNSGELGVAIRNGGDAKNTFKMYQRLAYLPRRRLHEGLYHIKVFIRERGLTDLFKKFHR